MMAAPANATWLGLSALVVAIIIAPAWAAPQSTEPTGCTLGDLMSEAPAECQDDFLDPGGIVVVGTLPPTRRYEIGDLSEVQEFSSEITIYDAWCQWVPCNLLPPPRSVTRTEEKTEEVCWQIGGAVSIDAKLGLAVRLLTELGANVSVNGQVSGCEIISESESFTLYIANCWDTKYWEEYGVVDVAGTVFEREGGLTFWCDDEAGGGQAHDVWCPEIASNGIADEVTYVHYRTDEVRCCEDPPPPADPCCGCYAPG